MCNQIFNVGTYVVVLVFCYPFGPSSLLFAMLMQHHSQAVG